MRIGVCGTAHWAEAVHLPGLADNPDLTLVGVHGRNPTRTAALADTFRIRAYAAFGDLLADVDAVSFAVPPAVQGELASLAVAAGRHVILEKPVADSVASARAVAAAARASDVAAVCFLTRLFVPTVQDFLAQARAAQPTEGEATFRSGALLAGPYVDSAWRKEDFATLWDGAPHGLSVLASVLGPVREVEATADDDGTFRVSLAHEGGRGTLVANQRDPALTLSERYAFSGGDRRVELSGLDYDRRATFTAASRTLVAYATGADRGHAALDFAVHLVAVSAAAEAAARSGRTVRVSP